MRLETYPPRDTVWSENRDGVPWCTRCVNGAVPLDDFEHIVDDCGDIVCRETLYATDPRRVDRVLKRALGSETWYRMWGQPLERLGEGVDELLAQVRDETAAAAFGLMGMAEAIGENFGGVTMTAEQFEHWMRTGVPGPSEGSDGK